MRVFWANWRPNYRNSAFRSLRPVAMAGFLRCSSPTASDSGRGREGTPRESCTDDGDGGSRGHPANSIHVGSVLHKGTHGAVVAVLSSLAQVPGPTTPLPPPRQGMTTQPVLPSWLVPAASYAYAARCSAPCCWRCCRATILAGLRMVIVAMAMVSMEATIFI